jgi:hypothetical protein
MRLLGGLTVPRAAAGTVAVPPRKILPRIVRTGGFFIWFALFFNPGGLKRQGARATRPPC